MTTIADIVSTDGVEYSWNDGGYHKVFTYNNTDYEAILLPQASTGSTCSILRVDDADDISNVTASTDLRKVFFKRFNNFKEINLINTIKEFIKDYAI